MKKSLRTHTYARIVHTPNASNNASARVSSSPQQWRALMLMAISISASGATLAACGGSDDDPQTQGSAGTSAGTDGGVDAGKDAGEDAGGHDSGTDAGHDAGPTCDTSAGLELCGETCVDLQSDHDHCGTCDKSCGPNEACQSGDCKTVCIIDGETIDAGAVNPSNSCTSCDPATSGTTWSPHANGMACADGKVCANGVCDTQCFIDGMLRGSGSANPDNACQTCDPASSTVAWASAIDGTNCGGGEVCASGVCNAECFIDSALYAATTVNPSNPCEQCNPAVSTSAWSSLSDGAACDTGKICDTGACQLECFIDATLHATEALNPSNACEVCEPTISTSTWTPLSDGTSCGAGQVCNTSVCEAGCFIDGSVYPGDVTNPANPCEQCIPAMATTTWALVADGASCGAGKVCNADACTAQCFIENTFYNAGVANPANPCEACDPATSTAAWTARSSYPILVGGTDVAAQGWSLAQQSPNTLTYGADYVRLETHTNTGAQTSGQLLLWKAGVVTPGQPFGIQVELLLESSSGHNQLDAGAAIMASFTPTVGNQGDRQEMIYLESGAIGWSDNTQASAISLVDNAYHVYQVSVDAAHTATVSIDGVAKLTRANFTTNGTIAVGDQTNDPNFDGVMRIRSVSKLCP